MTLSEFKAWFEGYTEGLETAPTKAQFERIKEKVKEIDGSPVTYPIYIDRYVEPLRPYWTSPWPFTSVAGTPGWVGATGGMTYASNSTYAPKGEQVTQTFDSHAAMFALGKAEAMH